LESWPGHREEVALKTSDVIIVGAGSVGVPTAMALGELGIKTRVIDMHPSPGQGENKHAIGGIRATHSDPGKILICRRSLEIFASWEKRHGDDIEWLKGGYAFPVYRKTDETMLKKLLPVQKKYKLNIDYLGPEEIKQVMAFHFKERVRKIQIKNNKVIGVKTDQARYAAPVVVDAAGPFSTELGRTVGVKIPVVPDSHEGAITEPVRPFFKCMVVDIRPGPGSKNFYFYQNLHGQVIFCITPDPPIIGTDKGETSVFLPQVSARIVHLFPRLKNLRVRRTWRGLYPMTPDGSPIVGRNRQVNGLLHAAGMCGQGLMLGPGVGELLARMIADQTTGDDQMVLEEFSPYRKFKGEEALK
jgi:sarcosine oxidase subunit beta